MKFGEALEAVKEGALIARSGWNANDNIVNGWLASQSDMLADDWMVVG